jgi:peptide-methionine (S)-S-oxide reductase
MRSGKFFAASAALLGISLAAATLAMPSQPVPPARSDAPLAQHSGKAVAVFAGGCFWGTQSVFERVKGVLHTEAGYSGGSANTATSKITYGELLRIFFSVAHDPTQLNRQGLDVGTSYRSAIFYNSPEQRKIATAYIAQLDAAHVFPRPIVTEVTPLKGFYEAEAYHQDYALKNPDNPYIEVCDRPKIEALRREFPQLFVDYKGSGE